MKSNKDVLGSVLKTTQMGQIGIRSAMVFPLGNDLQQAMKSQLNEYDAIETEAKNIAHKNHWELKEVSPVIRFMVDRMTKIRLTSGNPSRKIAAMMIRGNTSGEIKGFKNLHQLNTADPDVTVLANKLLETEKANIQQMKPFL